MTATIYIEKKDGESFFVSFSNPNTLIVTIRPAVAVGFQFINVETGDVITMLKMTYTQQVALSLQPVDAAGNPAEIDGEATWDLANPAVGSINVDPTDSLMATFVASEPGTTQVNVSADADLGSGTTTITGLLDVEVLAGQAVSLEVTAGTPEEQPPVSAGAQKAGAQKAPPAGIPGAKKK